MPDKKKKRPSHKFRKERWDRGLSKAEAAKKREEIKQEKLKAKQERAEAKRKKDIRRDFIKAEKADARTRKEDHAKKVRIKPVVKFEGMDRFTLARKNYIEHENARRAERGESGISPDAAGEDLGRDFWSKYDEIRSPSGDRGAYRSAHNDLYYDEDVIYEPYEGDTQ